jgi:hypothetical protein
LAGHLNDRKLIVISAIACKDPGGFTTVHSSKPEEKFSSSNVWSVTDETTVISVASANRRKLAVFVLSVSVNIMLEK